ncbi:hypothetical protein XENOCAPTIV_012080 [Xenoophorus captivus]|uniref:Vitellinogen beta-sheet shell domain-containing protein n=1 Tax=Xenoophorus captivus TaxID=1517983 RepID=A0ABV0RHE9_9TELE
MKATTAYLNGSKPELKAKVQWNRISEYMAEIGKRIERYIPGVAFLYGFSQENERNPEQEVSATVVAAWTDSVEVKIKLPEKNCRTQMPARCLMHHCEQTTAANM